MPRGVLKIGRWGREASGEEFAALMEAEIEEVETLYERAFGGVARPLTSPCRSRLSRAWWWERIAAAFPPIGAP